MGRVAVAVGVLLATLVSARAAHAVTVRVDPGAYEGAWATTGSPATRGSRDVELSPGRHWVRLGGAGQFEIEVRADATIVPIDPGAATGGIGILTFRSAPVTLESGTFAGYTWVHDVTAARRGAWTAQFVPGVDYVLHVGTPGYLYFRVTSDGTVTSSATASVVASGSVLALRTVDVTIEPNDYVGVVSVHDVSTGPAVGRTTFALVPNIDYLLHAGHPGTLYFRVDALGAVTTTATASATGSGSMLSLHTATLAIDPGTYPGRISVNAVRGPVSGAQSVVLVIGLDALLHIGYPGTVIARMTTSSTAAVDNASAADVSGATIRLRNVPMIIERGRFRGLVYVEATAASQIDEGDLVTTLVPGIDAFLRLGGVGGMTFRPTPDGSVEGISPTTADVSIGRVRLRTSPIRVSPSASVPYMTIAHVATLVEPGVFDLIPGVRFQLNAPGGTAQFDVLSPCAIDPSNPVIGGVTFAFSCVTTPTDTTPPVVSLDPLPALTASPRLTISGTATDDGTLAAVAIVLNGTVAATVTPAAGGRFSTDITLAEGPNTIVLRATDSADHAASASAEVRLDSVAPAITVLAPTASQVFATPDVAVRLRVTDDTATTVTVAGTPYTPIAGLVDATVTLTAEGEQSIAVSARDAAGNERASSVVVRLDLSAPVATSDTGSTASFARLAADQLPLSVRVDEFTASTVHFSFGGDFALPAGGGVVSTSVTLTEGANAFTATVTDEAGHVATLAWTVTYDVTSPTLTFGAPAESAFVRGGVDVTVFARDTLSGIASASLTVDDAPPIAGIATADGFAFPWSTALLADGTHTLAVQVEDRVGNVARLSRSVTVDNTPPSAAVVTPADGAVVGGSLAIVASAADATSGIETLAVSVNGTNVGTCSSGTDCTVPFDTTTLANGTFNVTVVATDRAGNTSPVAQRTLTADNTAPSRFLVSPAPGSTVGLSLNIAVHVDDANFDSVECFVDGVSLGRSTSPTFATSFDLSSTLDGPATVRCDARDAAGNVGTESASVTVRNWHVEIMPRTLNVRAPPPRRSGDCDRDDDDADGRDGPWSRERRLHVAIEGPNVGILLPVTSRALTLRVPGGAPVPLVVRPVSSRLRDRDSDGVPDVLLKFDRDALAAAIRLGIATGVIDGRGPVRVALFAGEREIGSDTIRVHR